MMKEKPWDLFYTYTASDRTSPSLSIVNQVFKTACSYDLKPLELNNSSLYEEMVPWYEEIEYNKNMYQNLYKQNLMFITRIWERTSYYFNMFLEKSPSKIFGKVDGHFSRKEFQSTGSPGNKSHVHGGTSIEGMSKEELAELICLDPNYFFNEKYSTSYKKLLKDGLVEGESDFAELEKIVNIIM